MNKCKAKKALQIQLEKLDIEGNDKETWRFRTASLIKDIFGDKSIEYSFMAQFSWAIKYREGIDSPPTQASFNALETGIRSFLNDCIETIEDKGVYKPDGKNYVSIWENWHIIILIAIVFLIGLLIGGFI